MEGPDEARELSEEELEAEMASELPDREEMSYINVPVMPGPILGPMNGPTPDPTDAVND